MNGAHDFISLRESGVRLNIRARPGARGTADVHRAVKVVPVGDRGHAIEIAIAAPARKGKANHALIGLLADELGLPKTSISIRTGAGGRLKLIEINGPPQELHRRVLAWLANTDIPMTATNPKAGT